MNEHLRMYDRLIGGQSAGWFEGKTALLLQWTSIICGSVLVILLCAYGYILWDKHAARRRVTVLERDALVKIMKPVMSALPGEEIVACSGRVDMINGKYPYALTQGSISSERAGSPLLMMQYIEYVRAFLISGIGLVRYNINMLLFTSQAFGVFKKKQSHGNRRLQDGYPGRSHGACHAAAQTYETDERAWTYYIHSQSDLQCQSTRDMESTAEAACWLA
ncbi:hypothetical protein [Paenibacillus xylanivorans]|uniref:hypothetical protein n=1 Tax=Paenibacillus xylanivorans TaxID=1705561 RepID=UPI0006B19919|nr:hypothetical protein [Paenibacillus xylanivorans]